jgi:hypothetical protein
MSAAVAAWIAHAAFWILLVWGWFAGELRLRGAILILGVWVAAMTGLLSVPYVPFASWVAVLDIVLVFIVAKGDIRLT